METVITGRDFVFTGLQPWDLAIGSNARDIALEVSKNNRVLYVNAPLSRWSDDLKSDDPNVSHRLQVLSGKFQPLRQINENLWLLDFPFTILPVNSLPDGFLFDSVNRFNNRKIFRFVNEFIKQLGFSNAIHFIDNDIYRSFYSKEYLDCKTNIYYRRDNMVNAFWKRHAPRLEPLLCAKSDLVVANSAYLADMVHQYNSHTYDIGQGLDLGSYDQTATYPVPDDIATIAAPIVGYAGWITSLRLDGDLLFEVAKQLTQCSFVMVGGEDDYFKSHPLHELPNVYFLGQKPSTEIPSYIASFDICINPQSLNEVTIGNYPRKIDEYLAFGKPVVATSTPSMMMFDKYVFNCVGAQEYVEAISKALLENCEQEKSRRIEFAQSHTWANSVSKLYSHIK